MVIDASLNLPADFVYDRSYFACDDYLFTKERYRDVNLMFF